MFSGNIKRENWEEMGYKKMINTRFNLFVTDFLVSYKKFISRGIKERLRLSFFII